MTLDKKSSHQKIYCCLSKCPTNLHSHKLPRIQGELARNNLRASYSPPPPPHPIIEILYFPKKSALALRGKKLSVLVPGSLQRSFSKKSPRFCSPENITGRKWMEGWWGGGGGTIKAGEGKSFAANSRSEEGGGAKLADWSELAANGRRWRIASTRGLYSKRARERERKALLFYRWVCGLYSFRICSVFVQLAIYDIVDELARVEIPATTTWISYLALSFSLFFVALYIVCFLPASFSRAPRRRRSTLLAFLLIFECGIYPSLLYTWKDFVWSSIFEYICNHLTCSLESLVGTVGFYNLSLMFTFGMIRREYEFHGNIQNILSKVHLR